jgi:L-idonate 5-dehydrogenase
MSARTGPVGDLACVLHGAHDLRVQPRAPRALGPHDVRLRLGAGGICGSDLHYWQHGRAGAFVIREPLVPGHEASGVVEAIGAEVTRVKAGDRVAIDPSHPCGACDYCRGGRLNLCRRMHFVGSASVWPHAQGLFAQAFVVGERQLTPVPETAVSLGEIACAEPLSVGLHAARRAGDVLGRRVLVTGAGTIGCMCAIAARLAGAAQVTVADVADRPLDVARAVGADEVVRSDRDAGVLAERFDIAIEAAGVPAALIACLAAVERGGRVVQVGTLPDAVTLPANQIMSRELDFVGAFRANGEFDLAVAAIRTRRADVRPLISAQLPLARAEEAFALAADRSRSTKVQLIYE